MSLLPLVLWGGLVALDNVSAVQSMISRPLPAGIVAGMILGEPALGAQVGGLLELFLLVAIPAGGGRMPEGGAAAVVAVAAATVLAGPGALPLGVAVGLLWGQVAGWTQTGLRILNGRYVPVPGEDPVTAARIVRTTWTGVLLDYLRGALLTLGGAGAVLLAGPRLPLVWPWGPSAPLLLLGGLLSVGVLLRAERSRRAAMLFGVGMVLGVMAGVVR